MDTETIRDICKGLPSVTEEIKWDNDLCFMVGEKMFCVVLLDSPIKVSFKVPDEEFAELSNSIGIIPAPYSARYKWVLVEDTTVLNRLKWEHYVYQSYNLVRNKLSKKKQASLK